MKVTQPSSMSGVPATGQTDTAPTANYAAGDDGTFQMGLRFAGRFTDRGDGVIQDVWCGILRVKQPELMIPGATGVHATNQIQVAGGDWATAQAYAAATVVRDLAGTTATPAAITGATSANPCVVTATGHGLKTGMNVRFGGIGGTIGTDGTLGLNYADNGGVTFYIRVVDANQFKVYTDAGALTARNTTTLAFVAGGTPTVTQLKFYVTASAHTSDTIAADLAAAKLRETVWIASAASIAPASPRVWKWADAVAACADGAGAGLTLAGLGPATTTDKSGWRMPQINEEVTLMDWTAASAPPAMIAGGTTYFPNTQITGYYLTATTRKAGTSQCAVVQYNNSPQAIFGTKLTDCVSYVRPVAGGAS